MSRLLQVGLSDFISCPVACSDLLWGLQHGCFLNSSNDALLAQALYLQSPRYFGLTNCMSPLLQVGQSDDISCPIACSNYRWEIGNASFRESLNDALVAEAL